MILFLEHEPSEMNAALAELAFAKSQLHATGAVDFEPEQLDALERHVRSGRMAPEDARRAVQKILNERHDYH